MKDTTHVRKGREIRSAKPGEAKMYNSVNQAKKASRAIQMKQDKGLGLGSVKVIPFVPKKRRRKKAGKFNISKRVLKHELRDPRSKR